MSKWRWRILAPSSALLALAFAHEACSETGPDADKRTNGCLTEGCQEAGSGTDGGGPTDGAADSPPIVYPNPIEGTTKAATKIVGSKNFVEGPVWIGGRLLFTDVQNNQTLRLSGTT